MNVNVTPAGSSADDQRLVAKRGAYWACADDGEAQAAAGGAANAPVNEHNRSVDPIAHEPFSPAPFTGPFTFTFTGYGTGMSENLSQGDTQVVPLWLRSKVALISSLT